MITSPPTVITTTRQQQMTDRSSISSIPACRRAWATCCWSRCCWGGVYFSWLIFFFVRRDGGQWKRAGLAPYFAALGAAFMLVEVPLIQRFSLLLEQPVLALAVVVGGLLAGGGLGSLLSSRFSLAQLPRHTALAALLTAALALASLVVYPALIRQALPLDLPCGCLSLSPP